MKCPGAHSGIGRVTVNAMESSLEGLQLILLWHLYHWCGFTSTAVNISAEGQMRLLLISAT